MRSFVFLAVLLAAMPVQARDLMVVGFGGGFQDNARKHLFQGYAAATGEPVLRENPLPGAVLTRVAASHLRVGTFQFFAARGELDQLRRLAEYAIARHDPMLVGAPER